MILNRSKVYETYNNSNSVLIDTFQKHGLPSHTQGVNTDMLYNIQPRIDKVNHIAPSLCISTQHLYYHLLQIAQIHHACRGFAYQNYIANARCSIESSNVGATVDDANHHCNFDSLVHTPYTYIS